MLRLNGAGLLHQDLESSTPGGDSVPPSGIILPQLVGRPEVGATVSARPGVWAGRPVPEVRTTLSVGGAARRSPCVLGPEDDGQEIVVTDVAGNAAGEAGASSFRMLVCHAAPHALAVPENVSISAGEEPLVVDAGALFLGTSGGSWSVSCADGPDVLQLEVDDLGRVTLKKGTLAESSTAIVSYANSGGFASAAFTVFSNDGGQLAAPTYDGSLANLSITLGEPVAVDAGAAFSGIGLVFSASGLPEAVTVDSQTGMMAGHPPQTGRYSVTVVATNPAGSASGSFELDILEKPQELPNAPIYDGSFKALQTTVGFPFEFPAGTAFTGEALTYSATGLAPGLRIDAPTGQIAGIPATAGDFPTKVTASNPGGEASGSFSIVVAEPVPTVTAPAYNGSLQSTAATVGVAFHMSVGGAFTGDDLTFAAAGLAPGLVIEPSTGEITGAPTAKGTFAVTITAKNSAGEASGSFSIAVAEAGAVTPAAPTYDGGAPDLVIAPNVAMEPVDMSVHFTGADITYSAAGLPTGVSINKSTGVVSGTPSSPQPATLATVTAANGGGSADALFVITVGTGGTVGGGGTDGGGGAAARSITNTDNKINTSVWSGTLNLGAHDPNSRVFVITVAASAGLTSANLSIAGGTATQRALVRWTNRAVELWEITGVAASSVDYTNSAPHTFIAAFRTIGYGPIGGNPLLAARQEARDTLSSSVSVAVPANGAALFLTREYEDLTAPAGAIKAFDTGTGSSATVSGYWANNSDSPFTHNYTGSTVNATDTKYVAVAILEAN